VQANPQVIEAYLGSSKNVAPVARQHAAEGLAGDARLAGA
jgi:hypothetical protein